MINIQLTIPNKLGLHARASAKFVTHASHYSSVIEIIVGNKTVNGKSIMGIMMLAAKQGTELTLRVNGDDEEEAIKDLVQLIESRFGEAE
jgi:phosphocarrier protein HPr